MNVALRKPMALAEFLAWEREQDLRYEFDGERPVAMTGGTVAHSVVATNLVRALEDRLRGGPCRAFRGDVKIVVAGRVRYPDAVVTCSPVADDAEIVPDPAIVFEVLSASTASIDRIQKNEEYRLTASITHYVMLEQTRVAATVFGRAGTDWLGRVLTGDAVLEFPAIGLHLPLAAAYVGLTLSEPAGPESAAPEPSADEEVQPR